MADSNPPAPQADTEMPDTEAVPPQTNGTTAPSDTVPAAQTQAPPTPVRPSSQPPTITAPERAAAHGSPTRVFLNQNVTPHLLEGMKYIAAYEPEKPLRWLSEFLAKRSAEIEGS